jgi:hypothetical protein
MCNRHNIARDLGKTLSTTFKNNVSVTHNYLCKALSSFSDVIKEKTMEYVISVEV